MALHAAALGEIFKVETLLKSKLKAINLLALLNPALPEESFTVCAPLRYAKWVVGACAQQKRVHGTAPHAG